MGKRVPGLRTWLVTAAIAATFGCSSRSAAPDAAADGAATARDDGAIVDGGQEDASRCSLPNALGAYCAATYCLQLATACNTGDGCGTGGCGRFLIVRRAVGFDPGSA